MMQYLSLYNSQFASIRELNRIYVDKTDLVYELAKPEAGRWYFLSRPRRFGKSLLISTFAELFRNGLKNFAGLKIADLWRDQTCKVLHLDFSLMSTARSAKEFLERFDSLMTVACRQAELDYERMEELDVQDRLGLLLGSLPNSSLAILIDEYDAPLVANMNDPDSFADMCRGYSAIFQQIKSFQGAVRFFFMTGVVKISLTGIFSGFNNIQDISLKRKYGTLLGYTEKEVETYFSEYLDNAADVRGMSRREVLDRLRENYDGYCFDEAVSTHVYAPWSVMSFLSAPEDGFKCYWYDSAGKPSVLVNFLKRHGVFDFKRLDEEVRLEMSELGAVHGLSDMNADAILFQSGYLTFKKVIGNYALLDYPNKEVRRSMEDVCRSLIIGNDIMNRICFDGIIKPLRMGEADVVVRFFNELMSGADYTDAQQISSEGICRFCIYLSLRGLGLEPRPEMHNAYGRSDLELDVGNKRWVFEFKFATKKFEVDKKLAEAAHQMEARHYGEARLGSRELIRVALVYCAETRRFSSQKLPQSVRIPE
ncbi:AAA family ATPase [uncultured Sutterella sp.]|uniref:AAA family ATPase n=1 Tax=uncultured Sutterella sp. TaxID=286133 RepID=UPI00261BBB56|nr:AAA family ATPase [uncultured Sutterella sp.]